MFYLKNIIINNIKIYNLRFISIYLFGVSSIRKYPNKVDNNDPDKTPNFTPLIYCELSGKAKFPTNKLIVKPIPVNMPTP